MATRFRTSRPSRMRFQGLPLAVTVLAGSLLAGSVLAQSSEIYQWKDAKGVTHYSDAPPPKGKYDSRVIEQRPATPATPATAASDSPPDPAASADGSAAADARARADANAAKGRANCELAKTNLTRLQASGDVGVDADGDGTPDSTLDEAGRAQQTQLAQANIDAYCGTAAATPAP